MKAAYAGIRCEPRHSTRSTYGTGTRPKPRFALQSAFEDHQTQCAVENAVTDVLASTGPFLMMKLCASVLWATKTSAVDTYLQLYRILVCKSRLFFSAMKKHCIGAAIRLVHIINIKVRMCTNVEMKITAASSIQEGPKDTY